MPIHLRIRAGVWHYSRTVPPDVRGVVGKRYWRFTLNTRSLRAAEAQRSQWDYKHQAIIDRVRGIVATPSKPHCPSDAHKPPASRREEPTDSIASPSKGGRRQELTTLEGRHDLDSVGSPSSGSGSLAAKQPSLLNDLERWLAENKQKPSTVVKYRLHIRRLVEYVGDLSAVSLTHRHIETFVGAYGQLPNARALPLKQRKLTMRELLAVRAFDPALRPMGAVNVRKMIEYLRAFLRAVGRDDLRAFAKKPKDDRPLAEKRGGYPPIKPDELALILGAVENAYGVESDLTWWTWLLAYSGMRPEEAAQLSRDNVYRDGPHWTIKIDDLNARRVKNAQSLRTIPVHPKLIERGFLNFAHPNRKKEGLLFESFAYDDKGGRSNNPSRRLKGLLTKLGIAGRGSAHRFRPSFIDAIRNAELSYAIELALVGHSDTNRIHGRYGEGVSLKVMTRVMGCIDPLVK